jgi:uncharacterized FlaG/YvyC family protein
MEKQTQVEQGTQVETTKAVELPAILTANTFYWRPGRTARERRANEQRHYAEVEAFLEAHKEILQTAGIEVQFSYSESCNHVYKHIRVYQNGVRKDIRALKKALGIK